MPSRFKPLLFARLQSFTNISGTVLGAFLASFWTGKSALIHLEHFSSLVAFPSPRIWEKASLVRERRSSISLLLEETSESLVHTFGTTCEEGAILMLDQTKILTIVAGKHRGGKCGWRCKRIQTREIQMHRAHSYNHDEKERV